MKVQMSAACAAWTKIALRTFAACIAGAYFFSSMAFAMPPEQVRQLVEGSLIGFAQAVPGKALPAILVAPDGQPDLIFLPKIKGRQDANFVRAVDRPRTYETYFGRKRFVATLRGGKVENNFRLFGLTLADKSHWQLKGLWTHPETAQDDPQITIAMQAMAEPLMETFNTTCDAPGGASLKFTWTTSGAVLDKMFVARVPWREYPCLGVRELPAGNDYWRRFSGERYLPQAIGDRREGVFVQVSPGMRFSQSINRRIKPDAYPAYLVHVDSRMKYEPVEMLRPDLMMLDASLLPAFRLAAKAEFESREVRRDKCRSETVDALRQTHPTRYREYDLRHQMIQASCGDWLNPAAVSEELFIQTFVPQQWKKLWAH